MSLIREKNIKKILGIFVFMMTFVPFFSFAQYDQNGGASNSANASSIATTFISGIVQVIEWGLSLLFAYIILIVIIAGILFITSSGDEDRMDKALRWWKRSAIGLVLAPITYFIINAVGDALGRVG